MDENTELDKQENVFLFLSFFTSNKKIILKKKNKTSQRQAQDQKKNTARK